MYTTSLKTWARAVASFLISCILIGEARKKYRERLGIKMPDDT